ncbi:MAG: FtsX-like permease family protein [Terriglobales bacterium]
MLLFALILRPLRNDWGRTLLSLLAIALGVAVVIAIRVANRAAIASFQSTTHALAAQADLLVTGPAPIPMRRLAALFPLAAQGEITPYIERRAWDPAHQDALEVLGLDLVAEATERGIALQPDSAPPPPAVAGLPVIFLPARYAARWHLHRNERLQLAMGGRLHAFRIAIAPQGDLALLDLPDALADFEPGAQPAADGLRVILAPGASRRRFARRLAALVPAPDTVAPPSTRVSNEAKMLAAFRANLEALSFVALLIGLFLIYNTVSISVVRRRSAVAALRALGATRGQVVHLFLGEGAVLGLLGGALGVVAGWLLAQRALGMVEQTVESLYVANAAHPATQAHLIGRDWLWGLALALGAGLLAAWAPARQAAGIRPAEALRTGSAETALRRKLPWAALAALLLAALAVILAHLPSSSPWLGFACALAAVLAWAALTPVALASLLPRLHRGPGVAGLAAASLSGALRRSSVLTIAVAVAIGIMLGVAIMVGSFRATVSTWIGQQLQNDVFLQAADWDRNRPVPLPASVVAAAAATPGVLALSAGHSQPWTFRGQTVTLSTGWRVRGDAKLPVRHFLSGTGLSGAGAGPDSGAAIVSEPFARRFHLWTGDRLPLAGTQARGAFRIAGVFYDYASDQGLIVLPQAAFTRLFGPPAPTVLGADAAPGITSAELRSRLERRMPPGSAVVIADNASIRRQAMHVFDQTFRITYALEAITLLVAILGVANTLLAVVLERAPEFAVLRFLGATRAQIRRLLLAEAALVATIALALGWGIGVVLSLILARVINVQSFGWSIQFHPPYLFLALASAIVWLATVAAGWLPAGAAQRHAVPSALEAH